MMMDQVKYQVRRWRYRMRPESLPSLFARFQTILKLNNEILELMADMNDKSGGDYVFDRQYIRSTSRTMTAMVRRLIDNFNILVHGKHREISKSFRRIAEDIEAELAGRMWVSDTPVVMPYEEMTLAFAEVVGGKNANLAELKNKLYLPVPDGFAVTVSAFQRLVAKNELSDKIAAIISRWTAGDIQVGKASAEIQDLFLEAEIPGSVLRAIRRSLARQRKKFQNGRPLSWAVRSSALGEDSEHSFAGQFKTVLNVTADNFMGAYRKVLASTYSAEAMAYRREKGIKENEIAMAVACQQTIHAYKSGNLLTLDPSAPETERMTLSACWGLGAPMVDGKIQPDHYRVARKAPHRILAMDVVSKPRQLIPLVQGGCVFDTVPEDQREVPCLTEVEILRIARMGRKIEKYFRKPQEVEWTIDKMGRLFILQARPLNIRKRLSQMVCDISDVINEHPVIFSNRGVIAQNGVAGGKVFVINSDEDLQRFPPGAILVAKQSSPKFAAVAGRAGGFITDIGSPTGHMATIAREFRIPTILNTGVATQLLTGGREITMDAEQNVVYEGVIDKLCLYEFVTHPFEESYEYRLLRRILKKISPLFLLDPNHKNFTPLACRTYHDITRFIHEMSVTALIENNAYSRSRGMKTPTIQLKSEIPLDLSIIDIGGGIVGRKKNKPVTLSQIRSRPMRAFLKGIQGAGAWSTDPVQVDFKGFMSSMTRTFAPQLADPKSIGRNLAVISEGYANVNLRLGYHFTLVDSYVSDQINDNYAYFRFLGGVTDSTRRSRRARLITLILEKNDFKVRLRQDLVVARIKKHDIRAMLEKITLLGRLVAFTRQLDVKMSDDWQIENYFAKFEEFNSEMAAQAV